MRAFPPRGERVRRGTAPSPGAVRPSGSSVPAAEAATTRVLGGVTSPHLMLVIYLPVAGYTTTVNSMGDLVGTILRAASEKRREAPREAAK